MSVTVQKQRTWSNRSPEIISDHVAFIDLTHKAVQNPEQGGFTKTGLSSQSFKSPCSGRGNILESGRSQRSHSYVASWAAARVLRQILPLVWKLLSSSPDVAAPIFLMIRCCRQRITETTQTRLHEKQLVCMLALLATI